MSKRLYIQDVATRDGFQIEATFVPTEDKVALIDRLSHTGLAKIEVTSFTSPKAIPNLRKFETSTFFAILDAQHSVIIYLV